MFFISCKDLMLYNQFYLLNVIAYMYLFVYGTLLSTEYNHQTIKSSKLVGEGSVAAKYSIVTVHYIGRLENGKTFDSSKQIGKEPIRFTLGVGQVIEGWDQGIIRMKVGGQRKLIIPPNLGYGDQDMGVIPPNSTLIFNVELIEVE